MSKPDKVVYVLGAGFSVPAGAPTQAQLLGDILRLPPEEERSTAALGDFREFLVDLGFTSEDVPTLALEDIYTPLDRCVADGTALKGWTARDLEKLREDLSFLISRAISNRIEQRPAEHGDAQYISDFAHYLVAIAQKRAQLADGAVSAQAAKDYDPFSVISLNWDILLDNALDDELCRKDRHLEGDYAPFGVVDYCCYISSLERGNSRIRSGLWSLGCRGYNVKLLKLHGSLNWLQCPNCQRLFVEFGSKRKLLERVGRESCRHCDTAGYHNQLTGSLVMPTFLKDLSNFQIKLVWQNAGVELMEAQRLVFIGYSLPQADFEFRQLLSRMVRPTCDLEVVLFKGRGKGATRLYGEVRERYRSFFGNRKIRFHAQGVEEYVKKLAGPHSRAHGN